MRGLPQPLLPHQLHKCEHIVAHVLGSAIDDMVQVIAVGVVYIAVLVECLELAFERE